MRTERPQPTPGTAPAVLETAGWELRLIFQKWTQTFFVLSFTGELDISINIRHSEVENEPPFLHIGPEQTT